MDVLTYRYRPRPGAMLMAFLFFGACTLLLASTAHTNDRGLILEGILHFDVKGATEFYQWMAGLCGVMAGLGFLLFLIGILSNQYVELTETELSAPRSLFSLGNTIVPVSSIKGLELRQLQQTRRAQKYQPMEPRRYLRIYHDDGSLIIRSSYLPDSDAFDSLCTRLAALRADRMATLLTARSDGPGAPAA